MLVTSLTSPFADYTYSRTPEILYVELGYTHLVVL